jgi:hypothetical protein
LFRVHCAVLKVRAVSRPGFVAHSAERCRPTRAGPD